MLDLKDLQMLASANQEKYTNCCIPRKYRSMERFEKELEKIDDKLRDEI